MANPTFIHHPSNNKQSEFFKLDKTAGYKSTITITSSLIIVPQTIIPIQSYSLITNPTTHESSSMTQFILMLTHTDLLQTLLHIPKTIRFIPELTSMSIHLPNLTKASLTDIEYSNQPIHLIKASSGRNPKWLLKGLFDIKISSFLSFPPAYICYNLSKFLSIL